MAVCITINVLSIHSSFELDHHKFALTLYRTSQFVLALLLAFRLVSLHVAHPWMHVGTTLSEGCEGCVRV